MVRLYRTFSNYFFTGDTRFARCFCTCSRWFKRIEPPPTVSNHSIAAITRCVELLHEHPAHRVSPGKLSLEKVQYRRTTPNSFERPLHALLSLGSRRFDALEPPRPRVRHAAHRVSSVKMYVAKVPHTFLLL